MKKKDFTYDVAISFAEEDREIVESVVDFLKRKNIKYYYYKERGFRSWGKKLNKYLDSVYRKESRFCVVFVSKSYRVKRWTRFEIRKAAKRATKNINEYILPYKLDDTTIPGISDSIDYLSSNEYDSEALANAIYNKVEEHKEYGTIVVPLSRRIRYFFSKPLNIISTIILVIGITAFSLGKRIIPVDILANQIYEKGKVNQCAVCKDGHRTYSHGRGTCSHHGGVDYYKDTIAYRKTMEECREEAAKISWFPK